MAVSGDRRYTSRCCSTVRNWDTLTAYPTLRRPMSITTVFTNDLAEFERVPGLLTENWVAQSG